MCSCRHESRICQNRFDADKDLVNLDGVEDIISVVIDISANNMIVKCNLNPNQKRSRMTKQHKTVPSKDTNIKNRQFEAFLRRHLLEFFPDEEPHYLQEHEDY